MTITTENPERIRQLLADGNTVQQTADLTGWPRQRITAVINGTKGWLLDPNSDTVYQPGNSGMIPRLPDGTDPTAPAAPTPPAPEPKPAPKPSKPGEGPVAELLSRAVDIDDKAVQRDLRKATEAIAALRRSVTAAETKAAAAREIEELERKLADAKARLKGTSRRTTPAAAQQQGEAPARVIRAWAFENDVECTKNGVIPKAVRDQYNAAHGITP